jgi:hypothetical protein
VRVPATPGRYNAHPTHAIRLFQTPRQQWACRHCRDYRRASLSRASSWRLVLSFLARKGLLDDGDKSAVMTALANTQLPRWPSDIWFSHWGQHPAYGAWVAAFEALKKNADAVLPTIENKPKTAV